MSARAGRRGGIRLLAGALLMSAALTACGGGAQQSTTSTTVSPATSQGTTTPGGTMSSPLIPTTDVTDNGKPEPVVTIRGTVHEGVESGCLVLTTQDGKGTYQPLGGGLKAGDHVTVEGRVAKGVMTTCQQGTPFQVIRVVSHDE